MLPPSRCKRTRQCILFPFVFATGTSPTTTPCTAQRPVAAEQNCSNLSPSSAWSEVHVAVPTLEGCFQRTSYARLMFLVTHSQAHAQTDGCGLSTLWSLRAISMLSSTAMAFDRYVPVRLWPTCLCLLCKIRLMSPIAEFETALPDDVHADLRFRMPVSRRGPKSGSERGHCCLSAPSCSTVETATGPGRPCRRPENLEDGSSVAVTTSRTRRAGVGRHKGHRLPISCAASVAVRKLF